MKLQKGTQIKLTPENILFYLPKSVLNFKMSSNSVKTDSTKKWNRRLGHLNQADVVRRTAKTVECVRIGQHHKDSSIKSGRDPSRREAGESVHRHNGTFQSRVTVWVPVLHCVCRPVHEVCVCGFA